QPLFIPPSDFFESLSTPSAPLPPRPPSVPLDLEPTPLFSPPLNPTTAPGNFETSSFAPLPLQHQFSFPAHPSFPAASGGPTTLPAPMSTLFDSSEETYLNSFLSSFDVEGLDITPYVGSPPPMANLTSRTDFASMSLGMGIGAGVMSTMDDVIPRFSLDENPHGPTHSLSRMTVPSNSRNAHADPADPLAQNSGSFFEYGLGGTSRLSLGNVMSEEMHKVSSWLLQSQQQQSSMQSNMSAHIGMTSPNIASSSYTTATRQPFVSSFSQELHLPISPGIGGGQDELLQYPAPVSESDLSVKRKAPNDQCDQPRKSRGNMLSPRMPIASSVQRRNSEVKAGSSVKRRDSKKEIQRTVLTEEERRANHIASEQRRRNQIRQGYAELINLVTTLQDPALGNHPGTAQSTPSKAVILAHAIQFIRGLEEGNRLLRKQLEGTQHEIPHMHLSSAFSPA
ncbi:hypothetical protein EV180_006116, partial [Coemansia sp. RSA 518]